MQKTVLITGAGSELGGRIAETLSRAGHRVFATMRDPFQRNREAANRLWSCGMDVVALDVTDEGSIGAAVYAVQRKATRIDAVVNNARIAMVGAVAEFNPSRAQEALNTNVVGPIRIAQAVLPYMRHEGEGLIVNIGFTFGRVTLPFLGLHCAGSFALEAITDGLRYELSPYRVEVVLVQQSFSLTPAQLLAIGEHEEDTEDPTVFASTRLAGLAQLSTELDTVGWPDPNKVCDAVRSLMRQSFGERPHYLAV